MFDPGITISAAATVSRSIPGGKNSAVFTDPLGGAAFLAFLGPGRAAAAAASPGEAIPAAKESVRRMERAPSGYGERLEGLEEQGPDFGASQPGVDSAVGGTQDERQTARRSRGNPRRRKRIPR